MILALLLSTVFFILSLIHFNWVFGGKLGFEASLPTNGKGERVLNPRKIDSALVGIGLALFGLFYIFKAGLIALELPPWIFAYGGWIIPIIFILRAIGDFKYVGFFKRVKDTDFGKRDTRLFAPLCLAIGLIGMIVQLG